MTSLNRLLYVALRYTHLEYTQKDKKMNDTESAKVEYTYKINGESHIGHVEYNAGAGDNLDEIILNDLSNKSLRDDTPAMPRKGKDRKNYPYFGRRLLEEGVGDHIFCTLEDGSTKDIFLSNF